MFVPPCFLWGSNEVLSSRPPLLHSPFASFLCLLLRCHKRSYSLWFILWFHKVRLGTPKRTMIVLVHLKEYTFTRNQGKSSGKGGLFELTTFVLTLLKVIFYQKIHLLILLEWEVIYLWKDPPVFIPNILHSFTSDLFFLLTLPLIVLLFSLPRWSI